MFENAVYFFALLNPPSKVMFLASYRPSLTKSQIWELSWKSTLVAFLILITLASAGNLILTKFFRIELYSLRITGGLVLFLVGWNAIREGRFVQQQADRMRVTFTDLSLVPLAAPLIAGPGTIAAAISSVAETSLPATVASLSIALSANFLIMLLSMPINRILEKTHILGPLIRLTGLIIAAVSVQMIITGIRESRLLN